MENDILGGFEKRKKDDSAFLTLEDGESKKVIKLHDIKSVVKTGFGGEEKEVLRFIVDVETATGIKTKNFDNGTLKFAQEVRAKGVKIGSSFVITRHGLQTKTKYEISEVTNPQAS